MSVTEVYRAMPKREILPLEILTRTIGVRYLSEKYWPGSFGWGDKNPSSNTVVIPQGTELVFPNGKKVVANTDISHGFRYDEKHDSPLFWIVNGPQRELGINGQVAISDVQVAKYPVSVRDFPEGIYTLTRPLRDGETEPVQRFYENLDRARQILRMDKDEFAGDQENTRLVPNRLVENGIQESFGLVNVGADGIKLLLTCFSEMFPKLESLELYTLSRYFPPGSAHFSIKGNEFIPDRMRVLADYLKRSELRHILTGFEASRYNSMAAKFEQQLRARKFRR